MSTARAHDLVSVGAWPVGVCGGSYYPSSLASLAPYKPVGEGIGLLCPELRWWGFCQDQLQWALVMPQEEERPAVTLLKGFAPLAPPLRL